MKGEVFQEFDGVFPANAIEVIQPHSCWPVPFDVKNFQHQDCSISHLIRCIRMEKPRAIICYGDMEEIEYRNLVV